MGEVEFKIDVENLLGVIALAFVSADEAQAVKIRQFMDECKVTEDELMDFVEASMQPKGGQEVDG